MYDDNRTENQTATITLGTFADKAPLGLFEQESYIDAAAKLVVSQTVWKQCFAGAFDSRFCSGAFAVKAADLEKADSDIRTLIKQTGSGYSYYNYAANAQENRNTLLVANVLSYGFIVLISLITVANVFNTISTNVNLRRREFAMLKSVGMTPRGFNKMMNFECIFYGLKALLYGLPISLLISLLIRQSLNQGIVAAYELPWLSAWHRGAVGVPGGVRHHAIRHVQGAQGKHHRRAEKRKPVASVLYPAFWAHTLMVEYSPPDRTRW